jgi:hypothetical protein
MENDLKRLEALRPELEEMGYSNLKVIDGRGICGLYPYIHTIGLTFGITNYGYDGRYCYSKDNSLQAVIGLGVWDGKDDPIGAWIKYKGVGGERSNEKY